MGFSSVVALAIAQWTLAVTAMALVAAVTGSVSAAPPAIAMMAGAALWTAVRGQRVGWMSREQVRWLTPRVGLLHAVVGAAAYTAVLWLFPASFADVEPVAAVLAGALFGGLSGLVLTLCGVNAVNMEWGTFNGREA